MFSSVEGRQGSSIVNKNKPESEGGGERKEITKKRVRGIARNPYEVVRNGASRISFSLQFLNVKKNTKIENKSLSQLN